MISLEYRGENGRAAENDWQKLGWNFATWFYGSFYIQCEDSGKPLAFVMISGSVKIK